MTLSPTASPFSRSLRWAAGLTCVLIVVFAAYVYSEKQTGRANAQRHQSVLLADQLQDSSESLTRLARTYVITGDPVYKQQHLDILDIREGRKPRPDTGTSVALLAQMRQAGFSEEEFAMLTRSKADSDTLTAIEFAAMALMESAGTNRDDRRIRASAMLHDADYHQFKADIMGPIQAVMAQVDQRTRRVVHEAEETALLLRVVFILAGLGLLLALWRSYQNLNVTLGGPVDEVHAQITRLGQGDFVETIDLPTGLQSSVLGGLARTQSQLHALAQARLASEAQIKRLTQLYAALSACNQAIVRCTNELQLFEQICQAVVVHGGLQMAWIGLVDAPSGAVKPLVSFGADLEYLSHLRISVNEQDPMGQGPTGTALRQDQPFWCQDYLNDPVMTPWHVPNARYHWGAIAALPLHRQGRVTGVLSVYADTVNAFDEQVQQLLIEMASDIDYALLNFDHAAARALDQSQLHLVAKVFEQGGEAIIVTDAQGAIVRVNHAFSQITGYSEAQALGRNPSMLSSGRQDADFYQSMWAALQANGHWQGELWNRRQDGSVYPEWLSLSVLRDGSGAVTHYVGIATDLSRHKEDEAHIRQLADFDPLTGLPNRRLLQDRVATALSHAQRHGESLTLMFMDLDRFKNVNDSLGHHVGDELLVQVAQRLISVLREQDTVCRLGGDEFVLLCVDTDAAGAAHVATKLLESSAHRYLIDQQELSISFSLGIALYPQDGDSFEALSMSADTAMYRAKQAGRNTFRFFTAEMQAASTRALQLENALRRALELQQFHLVYQPQVSLRDGRIVGMEALLRWQHPTLGQVSPAEFIPVAEDSGLILSIGEWVLRTAAQQLRAWMDAGLPLQLMAVNLSAVQFRHANLPELVSQVLTEVGLAPECLELELTEGVAMDDPLGAIAVMNDLHQRGVRMSIDDFGTGYSSLSYLKKFQVYKLKIDQSFVRDIADDPDDKAIVVAIIALARSLGFETIAEGVETQAQLDCLREQRCDEVQGYFYSRPLPAAQFEAFVRQHDAAITTDV